jgi:hypothetical protein
LLANGSDLKSSQTGFVSQKRGRVSPLLLWRLSKANAGSATVLVDELDAGGFESPANREIV